jgi:hypothetical protein
MQRLYDDRTATFLRYNANPVPWSTGIFSPIKIKNDRNGIPRPTGVGVGPTGVWTWPIVETGHALSLQQNGNVFTIQRQRFYDRTATFSSRYNANPRALINRNIFANKNKK